MSKKLKMTALLAVLMVILMLAIGLVACNPKTNTYKVTTQFNAEQGDVTLAPEAKDGIYNEGTVVTVSVTAKSGYEFDALTVNTDANAALNNEGKYIFEVTADTQITVLFRSVGPAACEHKNLSALVAGKAATCMEAGVIAHYHCNDCGKDLAEDKTTVLDSTEIAINPNAHDFDVWVAEVPATCSATGTAAHKDCKLCHKHFDNDGKEIAANKYTLAIDSTAHKYGAMQDLKPATCSATGIKAHKDCELCHKHFDADGNEIPEAELTLAVDSTAHNFGTLINGTPATCSAKGEKAHYHCSLCNKDIAEDKATILDSIEINIDPTAHKYGEMQQQKDATCAVAGTKAHKDCTLCGKHFGADNVEIPDNELEIPATGNHTYDKLVNVNDENGHEVHCSVCDAKQSETLTPHTYGTEYVQDGVQGHHQECACGYHTEIEKHDNGKNPYTDYEGETHSFECEKCGRKVTDEHTMGAWQIDGEGKHYRACVCGKETEHGEHNFGESPVYTDSKDGTHHTVKCAVCEIDVEQEHTPRLVSDEESGHHTECTLCTYKSETTKHDLKYEQIQANESDGVISENPGGMRVKAHRQVCDCGYKTQLAKCTFEYKYDTEGHWQECTICNYKDKEDKDSHTIETIFDKDNHWQGCHTCGYVEGDKSEHDYDESVYKNLTNTLHYTPCKNCSYVGHNQENHVYEGGKYQPTPDDEKNTHQQICDKCDHVNTNTQQHEWDEETHTTEDGQYEYHICTKCKAESEHTRKTHTHQSADGAWLVENGQHYQLCKECSEHFNVHDPEYTLNDGWYEGEGVCEHSECNISIYTFDSATNTLTGYSGSYTKIKLPSSIGGVQVTTLGAKNATAKNSIFATKSITNVMLPDSITTINQYAFASSQLAEIDTNKVTNIGMMAFSSCSKLTKVTTNAATMGQGAFLNCTTLDTAILKENASIGKQMFYGCKAIKTVVIESTVVPTVASTNNTFSVSTFTVYYKFSKEVYDDGLSNMKDQNLLKATIKYYYESKPSTSGIEGVDDSDAWYYDADGQIKLWSDPA